MHFIPRATYRQLLISINIIKSAYGSYARIFNNLIIISLVSYSLTISVKADEGYVILALGDSLTAGYGLEEGNAFPHKLEDILNKSGIQAKVINGGVSGDTTAGGLSRLDWMMSSKPNLVVIELGANDGLRGLKPTVTRANLAAILAQLNERQVNVLLTGMLAPPNLGVEYEAEYNAIFPELAKKFNVPLYPFFLTGVIDDPKFNQKDGIHPNADGVDVVVANIFPYVVAALEGKQHP